jgi:hypothetical protein
MRKMRKMQRSWSPRFCCFSLELLFATAFLHHHADRSVFWFFF